MTEEKFLFLLDLYLRGEISDQEKLSFFEAVASSRFEIGLGSEVLKELQENSIESDNKINKIDSEKIFQSIISQPQISTQNKTNKRLKLWLSVAACLTIFILGGYFVRNRVFQTYEGVSVVAKSQTQIRPGISQAILTLSNGKAITLDSSTSGSIQNGNGAKILNHKGVLTYQGAQDSYTKYAYNTIMTGKGNQYQLILPDGSHVWLNASSSLKYPTVFSGKNRRVELTGEAYFEVKHNAAQPFEVAFSNTIVKDIGTAFNIKAYADEPTTQSTLVSGSIQISQNSAKPILLKPGSMAVISKENLTIKRVNTDEVSAWKNGLIYISNASLQTVFRELSRWYNVDFIVANNVTSQHFGAVINKNVQLVSILTFLTNNGIKIKQEGRKIYVF